jgi:UPF0755 protein
LLRWWEAPLAVPAQGLRVELQPGESLSRFTARLHAQGVVQHPHFLNLAARLLGVDQALRHGEYELLPGLTPMQLLELLRSGITVRYRITLPEGITLAQALERLRSAPALRSELQGVDDPRLLTLASPRSTAEGLFLPDTYQYQRGDTDLDVLTHAHTLLLRELEVMWSQRAPGLPYDDPYEALILASIVERETGVAAERSRIASVFLHRLQRGMRLQTDPAVIYGLGSDFDGNLTRSHLRDDANPYNTYRHHGLPPSPIALPGRAALEAALHPAEGDALYFVARGDGSHEFSSSLEAHERAVRAFQLQRRADYRSSPPTEDM